MSGLQRQQSQRDQNCQGDDDTALGGLGCNITESDCNEREERESEREREEREREEKRRERERERERERSVGERTAKNTKRPTRTSGHRDHDKVDRVEEALSDECLRAARGAK